MKNPEQMTQDEIVAEVTRLRAAVIPREESPVAVVEDINQMLWERLEKTRPDIAEKQAGQTLLSYTKLSYGTDGTVEWIDFLGASLWDSENDPRPWVDDSDARTTTLHDFVLKTMVEVVPSVLALIRPKPTEWVAACTPLGLKGPSLRDEIVSKAVDDPEGLADNIVAVLDNMSVLVDSREAAYIDAAVDIYERFMKADRLGVVMQPDGDAKRLAQDVVGYINASQVKLAEALAELAYIDACLRNRMALSGSTRRERLNHVLRTLELADPKGEFAEAAKNGRKS